MNTARKNLQEMELLRNELYAVVNGKRELLHSKEICEVSTRLDKLIVKHMCNSMRREKTRY